MKKGTRICKHCGKEKSLDGFYSQIRRGREYWGYVCIECRNTQMREEARELVKKEKAEQDTIKKEVLTPAKKEKEIVWHTVNEKPKLNTRIFCKMKNLQHLGGVYAVRKGDLLYCGRFFNINEIKEWRYV